MLDRIDRIVLTELDRNARIGVSELARQLKLGRDVVEYRLEKLADEGVLRKTMAVVNPHALGYMIFKCYLRLRPSITERRQLLEWLKRKKSVFWVAETWGRFDAIFSALVRSPQEFDDIQSEILSTFPNLVLGHEMALTVDVLAFSRRHLVKDKSASTPFHWGGELRQYELSSSESKMLGLLSENGRLSLVDLAEKCDSTPQIMKRRLEQLQDEGIIVGYRTQIDLTLIGFRYVKVQLELGELKSTSKKSTTTQQLERFCESCSSVTYLVRQLGGYRAEIESEEPIESDYGTVLHDLDAAFGDSLRGSEILLISKDHHHRLHL